MNVLKTTRFVLVFIALGFPLGAQATPQEETEDGDESGDSGNDSDDEDSEIPDENEDSDEDESETSEGSDELEDAEETDDDFSEDDEDYEDYEDYEEDLEEDEDAGLNLDMSALGKLDPEKELSKGGSLDENAAEIQAVEEWTERELEILELHGYFRVRPELYDSFRIRDDEALYIRPAVARTGETGEDCRSGNTRKGCKNNTLAGANLRFRVEPTLNISEEVRVKAQMDFLDNVMLGSTPRYWQTYRDLNYGMTEIGRLQGWDMGPPDSDAMVVVRRAWGEVMTPFGQLRFGRMADHFGLGMLHNAGNGLNQDFGDTVDRIMFAAKINDWLIAPAFDFPSEGISSVDASGRPFDVSQLDDAYQLTGIFAYKHDREEQAAMLRRGDMVINSGLYFTYRWQVLSFEEQEPDPADPAAGSDEVNAVFYRRDMWAITPNIWFQLLYDTFHLEFEGAIVYGEVGNPDKELANFDDASALTLLQYGGVLQIDYGLLSDQLRIGLETGFASGDEGVEGVRAPGTYDQVNARGDDTFSAFSFNPAYNTDLILYHHILGSVSQSYYFNAWLRYDFLKSTMGRRLGVQADVLYSRAVYEKTTISNNSGHLGVELNASVMYVSDDNFHIGLSYGVLFPLAGFEGDPTLSYGADDLPENMAYPYGPDNDLAIPQTVQVLMGITY